MQQVNFNRYYRCIGVKLLCRITSAMDSCTVREVIWFLEDIGFSQLDCRRLLFFLLVNTLRNL